jgi:hypothetical protein
MKKQLLAGAMAVALATGMTTSAMAFRGGGGFHGGSFGGFHAGTVGGFRAGSVGGFRSSFAAMPANRFAGVRGFNTAVRPGLGWNRGWAGRRFVGGGWGWGGRRFVRSRFVGGFGGPFFDNGFDVGLGLVGFGLGVATLGYPYCSPYDYGWGWGWGSPYCGYPAYSTFVAY